MKGYYVGIFLVAFAMGGFLTGCKASGDDWSDPKHVYSLLCSCKNSQGQTIDEQWKAHVISKDAPARSADEINRYIAGNTEEFLSFIDDNFSTDTHYRGELSAIRDTLAAHNASIDPKGNIGRLFSVRTKYPACITALPYISM